MLQTTAQIARTLLIATLAVFTAVIVRAVCHVVFRETIPYTPFYPAIVAATMYGRLPGGITATVMAAFAASFWLSPFGQPLIQEPTDLVGLALFLGVSGLVVALCDAKCRAQQRAEIAVEKHKRAVLSEQAACRELEEASRLKDQFIACVSHELRTPLQAILGWAQVMSGGKGDAATITQGLSVIERNAVAQAKLIEDLLDISRITAGKMRLSPRLVNPQQAIEAAIQSVMLAAHAKQIAITSRYEEKLPALWADPDRLQQIVWNLLSNSIKFSPANTTVNIIVGHHSGQTIQIDVIDQGQGIEADFLPHIFDRFRQGDMTSHRRHQGLGLGLSIVKHLVELHGGSIQAASSGPNQGTKVTVILPIMEQSLSPLRRIPPGKGLQGVRVLVVDDDAGTCDLIARVLQDSLSDVVAVTSVEQALQELERFAPDVIISDIAMPGRDGYDLLREIRRRQGLEKRTVRAVALTALAGPEDQKRAFEAGFRLHLAKPVDARSLTVAVADLAGR